MLKHTSMRRDARFAASLQSLPLVATCNRMSSYAWFLLAAVEWTGRFQHKEGVLTL